MLAASNVADSRSNVFLLLIMGSVSLPAGSPVLLLALHRLEQNER